MSLYDDALGTGLGGRLPAEAGQSILNDADAATAYEQLRWLRTATTVTPSGRLIPRAPTTNRIPCIPDDKETTS
ncbi:hypothetical protein SAMN05216246_11213 [Actinomyces denticolens]|uniref:Uncharacterized protein n=1 Tax=Actinomyces denticolens TaxID=52767 RepID=A0ABY1IG68_9ACTO|nr:hypothetical protein [Actinomyces denticolens]SHJ13027.1 hypothetical protein SAMN05216246_11213 [Actinomyces denticolens]